MAQTTPDALFGPFFVFVGLHWPSLAVVGLPGPALAVCDSLSRFTMLINMPLSAEFMRWPGGGC